MKPNLLRDTDVPRLVLPLLFAILSLLAAHPGHAASPAPAGAGTAAGPQQQVETHATVRSIFEENDGRRIYIRLKLAQLNNKPFPILTYRVTDRAMLTGIAQGSSVAFTAARAGGENTITSLRTTGPCLRSQPCQ